MKFIDKVKLYFNKASKKALPVSKKEEIEVALNKHLNFKNDFQKETDKLEAEIRVDSKTLQNNKDILDGLELSMKQDLDAGDRNSAEACFNGRVVPLKATISTLEMAVKNRTSILDKRRAIAANLEKKTSELRVALDKVKYHESFANDMKKLTGLDADESLINLDELLRSSEVNFEEANIIFDRVDTEDSMSDEEYLKSKVANSSFDDFVKSYEDSKTESK